MISPKLLEVRNVEAMVAADLRASVIAFECEDETAVCAALYDVTIGNDNGNVLIALSVQAVEKVGACSDLVSWEQTLDPHGAMSQLFNWTEFHN